MSHQLYDPPEHRRPLRLHGKTFTAVVTLLLACASGIFAIFVASGPSAAATAGQRKPVFFSGKFNTDTRFDVALLGGSLSRLPVAMSNGDGSFTNNNAPIDYFADWAGWVGVHAFTGNFNRDGLSDVVLVGGADWTTIPVATSNGDGTFAVTNNPVPNFPFWAQSTTAHTVTGDFDGDGLTDIALVTDQVVAGIQGVALASSTSASRALRPFLAVVAR